MQFELDELNERQKKAVEHIEGPMLILAGAGSGKTRVITNRVAYLLQWGIDPENILALSFTNKAADEMEERVAQLTGPDMAEEVHLSTFHSLGANILRRDIDVLGYKRPFSILDQGDQLSVVENVMEDLNLDSGGGLAAPKILSIISRAKMGFCEPEDLAEYKYDYARPYAQRVYTHYRRALRGLNAVDFDDLLCLPIELFRADENIRKKYGDKFQYVMVDEYQDTNQTQLLMLRELVKDHENLCVVGDDDQSIYGFRGAIAENILRFEEEFDQTETIKLEQNYRSTNNILEAANVLIEHNSFRKEKELWSAKGKGEKINWVESEDGEEEARFVAAEIERLRQQHRLDWGDFAILYRVNPQSQPFEKALNNAHIPFQVRGSTEFFDRKEVKDFVAYLQATLNHDDELSVRRIVNVPRRGIGPTTMERISNLASDEHDSFFEALQAIAEDPDCIEGIRYKSARRIRHFVETLEEFHDRILEAEEAGEPTAGLCGELLERIDLLDHVRSRENNPRRARERVGNVQEVIQSIEDFEKHSGNKPLRLFLESITLDRSDPTDDPDDKNAVQLMTLHSSKGLEFPAVFVVGMEQGYLPHSENLGPDDIAEERRLAYVGLTRAQRFLTLTSAMKRTRYGQDLDREPSVFLEELPDEKVRRQRARDRESMREQQEEINEEGLEGLRKAIFDK
jgi:DNA helicase-2/ATP-dependent DNA helicase PcrA